MNRTLYAVHKWLSAIAFVQFAVWTITGSFFAWTKQESLKSAPVDGAHAAPLTPPAIGVDRAMALGAAQGTIDEVALRASPSGTYYLVHGDKGTARLDARTGALAPVGREEAETIARRDQPGSPAVALTTLVESSPPIEYRECETGDCALPAWRVELADVAHTHVWIDATTGAVTTRRNDAWRTYDFLWSLHIMDYRGRESFHHPLMIGAAALALATVLSGVVLLAVRAARWCRRARRGSPSLRTRSP